MKDSYISCAFFPPVEYRSVFMTECFELVYHGGGGFSWSEVWNMPVPHRRFNLKKINEYLEKIEEMKDKQQLQLTNKTDSKELVQIPDYVSKASPKEPTFVSKVKSKK